MVKQNRLIKLILIIMLFIIVIVFFNNISLMAIKTSIVDCRKIVFYEKDFKNNNAGDRNTEDDKARVRIVDLDIGSELSMSLQISPSNPEAMGANDGITNDSLDKDSDKNKERGGCNILEDTHPLENFCKYGILQPWDNNLIGYIKDVSNMTCAKILPNVIKFEDGTISIDQEHAMNELNMYVSCKYRPIGGALWPKKNLPIPIGEWVNFTVEASNVPHDQIEVQCFDQNGNESELVYKFAVAHVIPKRDKKFKISTENTLSLNILEMDSVSRNAFRRHMPISFEYLTKDMKAFDLKGNMKVGDNTLPNLLPILTGLRYLNLSDDMLSDFALNETNDIDSMSSLWKEYKDKGCATLLNDDPVNSGRGFLYYPAPAFTGFHTPPTDYYFRPFYVYNRQYPAVGYPMKNASKLCVGNKFSFEYQLELHEQMSMLYKDICYFTFTSIAELGHDDSNNLGLMDLKLQQFVQRLYQSNALNKTVLIIMGDHGQRIGTVQHAFVGRIEERMPLFTIIFPEWFHKKYPKIMNNLRLNQNRLISNFDLYQTLKDVSDGNFDGSKVDAKFPRQSKGLSLLHNFIPKNRTCRDALIPENHCACLIPYKPILPSDPINGQAYDLIKNYTQSALKNFAECQPVEDIEMINITRWTLSQMVQHGVRLLEEDQLKKLQKNITGSIEYLEVEYFMQPMNISALIRIQNDIKNKLFFINSDPPLILNGNTDCKGKIHLPSFCKCIE